MKISPVMSAITRRSLWALARKPVPAALISAANQLVIALSGTPALTVRAPRVAGLTRVIRPALLATSTAGVRDTPKTDVSEDPSA